MSPISLILPSRASFWAVRTWVTESVSPAELDPATTRIGQGALHRGPVRDEPQHLRWEAVLHAERDQPLEDLLLLLQKLGRGPWDGWHLRARAGQRDRLSQVGGRW